MATTVSKSRAKPAAGADLGTQTGLTGEQARAIETRSSSVALSAGAGCGKTFVLTERYLAHLDPRDSQAPPAELSELVAITFTERAAREMRDRIRRQCFARLQSATDDGEAEYWWRLLRGLDAARVSTIHSFCGALLRSHAVEAQLDPGFRILEQMQADTLRAETVEDVLRDRLAAGDEVTIQLVVRFGLERLRDMLQFGPRSRSLATWKEATPDDIVARWQSVHRETVVPALLASIGNAQPAKELLAILAEEDFAGSKLDVMRERRTVLLDLLPKLGQSADPAGCLRQIREAARVQGGGSKSAWPSESIYTRFQAAAAALRDEIDKCGDLLAFDANSARATAELGLRWLSLCAAVGDAYDDRKNTLGFLDFDDLIGRTRELLTAPEHANLRERLSSNITMLLVDEFQDTDPEQVELVRALCGDVAAGKLFFVGDYKQSIYRFRGADPTVFRALELSVPPAGQLQLTLNFRSQPDILDFVNATFQDALGPGYQSLRAHRAQQSPAPAVEMWWAEQEIDPKTAGAKDHARRHEARMIAERLREMFDRRLPIIPVEPKKSADSAGSGVPALRPVRPGDVVLLFRVLSDVQHYEAALRDHGIDYYLVGGHAFYAQQEIFDVLNLLRSVASPCDEVSLAGALRSPFFSLADETLFWLAQHESGLSAGLFASRPSKELDEEQRRRVQFAARTLADLRCRKDQMPVADLIHEVLARTGYDAVLLAEFLGDRKLANLNKLIEQARALDRAGGMTLADFIVQLSQFIAQQPREALAATHPEETDVVRLMTIHQAKGLEFPVAIVVDVDRPRNQTMPPAMLSQELGPLVKPPAASDETPACCGYDLYCRMANEKDEQEITRLLYVAMTRAADRLILSSGVFNLEAPSGPWTRLLANRFDLQTGEMRGHIRLTDDEGNPLATRPRAAVTRHVESDQTASPSRHRHADIGKLVEQATRLAAEGKGLVPLHVGPVSPDPTARRQFSFSRLSGRLHAKRPAHLARPLADESDEESEEPQIDPRELGTLVHAVLADAALHRESDIAAAVERHAPRHLPDSKEGAAQACDMIARFLQSPRAVELSAAAEIHREIEFLLAWPLDIAPSDAHLLQGYIDCLYRDTGGWHLIDYKTGPTTEPNLSHVAANYELQMGVYALAAERILGQPMASLRLYFLQPGLEFEFEWNDGARRRAAQKLNKAIAETI